MSRSCIHNAVLLGLIIGIILSGISVPALSAEDASPSSLGISGVKFDDRNGDGFLDNGEPALPGWTIRLDSPDASLAATTDKLGRYSFSGLKPGRYAITEDAKPGWLQTVPGCRAFEVALTDKSAHNLNFGDISKSRSVAAQPDRNVLMHMDRDDLRSWADTYKALPKVSLSPDLETTWESNHPSGEEFSLLNYLSYCPKERNQLRCGNCWTWACTGIVEIELAAETGIRDRLSVQYISSELGGCRGGSLELFCDLLKRSGRVVPWSNANAQWQDGGGACTDGSCVPADTISTNPSYPVLSARALAIPTMGMGKEAAISNIKNVLHQKKAVFFSILFPTKEDTRTFLDFWRKGTESQVINIDYACGKPLNENEASAHAVLCVGYNDTDPNNRYWIMLNSWGVSTGRQSGIFRVNMDMDYDGTYQSPDGDGSYQAFIWGTLDVLFPDSLKSASSSDAAMYSSLGGMNVTSSGNAENTLGEATYGAANSGAANGSGPGSKGIWEPINLEKMNVFSK